MKKPNLKKIILAIMATAALLVAIPAFAARTDDVWQERIGTYIETQWNTGRNILINGVNKYLNFGVTSGVNGYGFRDNGGIIECKNSGGSWSACQDGNSGGAGSYPDYLGQVGDVSTSTLNNGYVLKYNTSTNKWESVATSTLGLGGTGLSSYDAWTHPASGKSATTSEIHVNGLLSTASSTIVGHATTTGRQAADYFYGSGTATSTFSGSVISSGVNGFVANPGALTGSNLYLSYNSTANNFPDDYIRLQAIYNANNNGDFFLSHKASNASTAVPGIFWDTSANNFGFNTTTPSEMIHVSRPASDNDYTTLRLDSGVVQGLFSASTPDLAVYAGSRSAHPLSLVTSNSGRLEVEADGTINVTSNDFNFNKGGSTNSNWHITQSEDDFLIFQRSGGTSDEHSLLIVDAPASNPDEATITTRLNFGSNNQNFVDWYCDNYATDQSCGIAVAHKGTNTPLPFVMWRWYPTAGKLSAVGQPFFINDYSGANAIGAYSSTSPGVASSYNKQITLQVGSSTASTIFQVDNATSPRTPYFQVNSSGASTTALTISNLTDGCVNITSGLIGSTGTPCASGGLSSYDAWTHPAYGGSATTSLLTLSNGFLSTASSSIISDFLVGSGIGQSTTTLKNALRVGTTTNSANALVEFNNQNTDKNDGILRIYSNATGGGDYDIRIDSPSPDIEFVNTTQSTPAGKFELGVVNDNFYLAGRNTADNSFTRGFQFNRPDNGGNFVIGSSSPTAKFEIQDWSTSATGDWMRFVNGAASAGGAPGLSWYNSAGVLTTARLSSAPGTSYTNSSFKIQVADSSKTLQDRLSIDVAGKLTFGNASSTILSANALCISTDCRTAWPATGLTSYDAWTHPSAGQSATTSLLQLFGNASTTQITSTSSAYLATIDGKVGVGTTTPGNQFGEKFTVHGTSYFSDALFADAIDIRRFGGNNPTQKFSEGSSLKAQVYWDVSNQRFTFQNNANNNADAVYVVDPLTVTGAVTLNSTLGVTGKTTLGNATSTLFTATTAWLTNLIAGVGSVDLSASTVKQHLYPSFSYATSTAWTATTTIPLGPAYQAETWNGIKCFTDTGTLNVSVYDGTNRMDMLNASTTVGTFGFSTNNSFTASEKRYVDIGTPASSPTSISCTVDKTIN